MSGKVHLATLVVDAMEPGDEHFIVWDDQVSGLGVRVTKYNENERETHLTGEQANRRGKVIDSPEAERPHMVRAPRLLSLPDHVAGLVDVAR